MNSQIELDLHPSPKFGAILLGLLAMGMIFIYLPNPDPLTEVALLLCTLLLFGLAAIFLLVENQYHHFSRWGVVLSTGGLACLGFIWLELTEFIILTVIPIMLAAILLNISAAILATVIETITLFVLWQAFPTQITLSAITLIIIGLWITLSLMIIAYRSIYQIARGYDTDIEQARHLVTELQDRKMELEQTLIDLAHANRELELLNERMYTLRMVAEEAQKAKTTFVAKISHEFRTPLNMIIGLIDTLTETPEVYGRPLPAELLKDLEIVHRNSKHLAGLINDVLDLSQTEVGRLILHREWVDLAEDIDTALAVVRPLLDKKRLNLQVDIPADLPKIYCDKTRIRQVILNLISNAARYTDQGGITLSALQRGPDVVITVADTGPGIAPEDIDRIFDPFCQGTDSIWREQGGNGLGLSISKQFIERHDGEIWLESEVGVGSKFAFKLPIGLASAPIAGPERWISKDWVFLERTSWPQVPRLPYKQRVILYDETGDLHPMLTDHFEEIEFIDTVNLSQVERELEHCPAHAVLINTASPDMLNPLISRARAEIQDTPILGCSLPPKPNQFLQAGAIDYLTKPITQDDLREALQALDIKLKHILIADDNPDFRQLLSRMLLIYEPTLEIRVAANGTEALKALEKEPPDLILLDVVMSGMNGWEVLRHKQKKPALADVPVIMVTAEDPAQQPLSSDMLLATIAEGLTIPQLLQCSLFFSKLLLEPEPMPDLELG